MLLLSLQNSHNSYETVIKDSNLNPDRPTWSKTLTPTVVNLPKVSSKPTLTIDTVTERTLCHVFELPTTRPNSLQPSVQICPTRGSNYHDGASRSHRRPSSCNDSSLNLMNSEFLNVYFIWYQWWKVVVESVTAMMITYFILKLEYVVYGLYAIRQEMDKFRSNIL